MSNPARDSILSDIIDHFMQVCYLEDLHDTYLNKPLFENRLKDIPDISLVIDCALSETYIMALARLYEEPSRSRPRSIPTLIKKVKNSIDIFSNKKDVEENLASFELQLKKYNKILEVLKIRRDKCLAHNDSKYYGKNAQKDKTNCSLEEFNQLVAFARSILEYLLFKLSPNTPPQKPYCGTDIQKLIAQSNKDTILS